MGGSKTSNVVTDRFAVAPVVGIALLIGLVVVTAIAMFVVGHGAMSGVRDQADTEQATAAMEQLSHDLPGNGRASADLPQEGTTRIDGDAGWMRVDVGNETVLDRNEGELGAVIYERGDTRIAYQGGGVWRRDGDQESTMVSPPPVQYGRGETPTLAWPVLSLAGADGPGDGAQLATVETERTFPSASANVSNPITENVTIAVHSEFYRGWGQYFTEQFDGAVAYDHHSQVVTVTLQGRDAEAVGDALDNDTSAIRGLFVNDGGDLGIAQNAHLDSYDSAEQQYVKGRAGDRSDVLVNGGFYPSRQARIDGDVHATGPADITNDVQVAGNVTIGQGAVRTSVSNDAAIDGRLSIQGDAGIAQDASVDGDVIVGGELVNIGGTFGGDVHVHGADSTIGDGGSDAEIAGTVYAADDVEVTNAVVDGDVYVRGDVRITSAATIRGDVTATGTVTAAPGTVDGSTDSNEPSGSVPTPRASLEPAVSVPDPDVDLDAIGSEFESDNDNDDADAITYDPATGTYELLDCGTNGASGGCELTAGRYYLDEIDLHEQRRWPQPDQPEALALDTTDGPIEIYVDGDVRIEDPASLEVVYDENDEHAATIYTGGDVRVTRGATVEIADDRTPVFEVFVHHDGQVRIEGGSTFRGALYGLEEGGDRTEIDLNGVDGTEFYGALLGTVEVFDHEMELHYDTDLLRDRLSERTEDDETPEPSSADVVYLHIDAQTVEAN